MEYTAFSLSELGSLSDALSIKIVETLAEIERIIFEGELSIKKYSESKTLQIEDLEIKYKSDQELLTKISNELNCRYKRRREENDDNPRKNKNPRISPSVCVICDDGIIMVKTACCNQDICCMCLQKVSRCPFCRGDAPNEIRSTSSAPRLSSTLRPFKCTHGIGFGGWIKRTSRYSNASTFLDHLAVCKEGRLDADKRIWSRLLLRNQITCVKCNLENDETNVFYRNEEDFVRNHLLTYHQEMFPSASIIE
jgi:hypothetical protein